MYHAESLIRVHEGDAEGVLLSLASAIAAVIHKNTKSYEGDGFLCSPSLCRHLHLHQPKFVKTFLTTIKCPQKL